MRAVLCAACALCVAACSLAYASDLNEARDSQISSSDASSTSSSSGTSGDGAAAGDGGSTTSSGTVDGAATTTFVGCASVQPPPKFCKDFDDGKPIEDWGDPSMLKMTTNGGGSISTDDLVAFSKPRSVKIRHSSPSGCFYTRFERKWTDVGKKRIDVRFRFRPAAPWSGEFVPVALFIAGNNSGEYCQPLLYVGQNGADGIVDTAKMNVQYGNPIKNDVRTFAGHPRLGEWNEIGMSLTPPIDGSQGAVISISFTHEDGSKSEKSVDFAQCPLADVKSFELDLGFHCESGTVEANYDDVRVDWQ